ncbi:uncharacterized protein G2W53_001697 [Senna tora]|uniref:Uncharacterized protein n=1 Tax=Senna tora TaxID=362788 RepID=A0A834XJ18_9FABA|nr:uncharacterized protein G2W53_001697 [Senna tora]
MVWASSSAVGSESPPRILQNLERIGACEK